MDLGTTHTSFSPEAIFNNIFTFDYRGWKASIQSQYVGEQYMSNTDVKEYVNYDGNGNEQSRVGMMLKDYFTTNLNLSYTFGLKKLGLKELTLGVTLYNVFDSRYDNNGWTAPGYQLKNGKLEAYCVDDLYEAGFAPSAPFNWMAHLSLNF
jgi:iron complex outermembrane receptor protein